ncbi:hypothetical protein CPB83DRAFT_856082 [Crepidotus variabilis]|uniref:T4 RNA ligase 1-like N-terminal domain-containing protein n=1 Tax=Crepidotus variabilis TaxID=179855 RepID=A0A9P6EEA7_9AGAR|nr:hypothetical protein CPB83DRAFT_856082 [Crepidotus variabilis]
MPANVVDAFADTWGFIKTPTKVLNSVQEVRDFTGICAEKGEWQGEPVEGFVIRATTRDRTRDIEDGKLEASVNDRSAKAPYPPNSSFFFKVKFEEPYMMYRDWREITKTLVSVHSRFGAKALTNATSHLNLPKPKLKRPETKLYLEWVVEEIQKNPKLFDGYLKGKGIVSSRERFLEWKKRKDENGGDSGDTSVALTTKEIILD